MVSEKIFKVFPIISLSMGAIHVLVGELKLRIVQKHTFFAPESYTAEILCTDSLNSA